MKVKAKEAKTQDRVHSHGSYDVRTGGEREREGSSLSIVVLEMCAVQAHGPGVPECVVP